MKREITPADREIIESINNTKQKISFISKLTNRDTVSEYVFRLKEISSLGGIRYIAPYLFHSNPKIRDMASRKVHELYQQAEDKDLQWLDDSMRGSLYYRYDLKIQRHWYDLGKSHVTKLDLPNEVLSSVLCILCSHSNGYLREASLKRLIKVDSEAAIRMLFIRVNDWVEKVSVFATNSLAKLVRDLDESQLADFLVLVEQLRCRSRQDHSNLILEVEQRFSSSKGQVELVKAITHSNYRVARSAFLIARRLLESKEKVFEAGRSHKDPLIRSWSLELATEQLDGVELTEYLLVVTQDKLGMLRKKAIYKLLDVSYEVARASLLDCLSDSSPVIRHMARFYITREEEFNYADYYRNSLEQENGATLVGVISGLAETGKEEDWEQVLSFENHLRARVKAAVITASEKLKVADKGWLFSKLINGCPSEIKAAKQVLLSLNDFTVSEIVELHHEHFKGLIGRVLRQLLAKKCYWHAAKLLLQAWLGSDEDYSLELGNWIDQHGRAYWFVKPETQLLVDIINLTTEAQDKLGKNDNLMALHDMAEKLNNWKI